jgi:HSP20 family protein
MAIRDLIPWTKNQELAPARENSDPFLTLHREMNRLFDDVFRGFGNTGLSSLMEVSAELPGMTEKDVEVEIANGVLTIRGEKKAERTGEGKYFTERYYGSFERAIPLEDIQEDKVEASFKNGVLTISLPKSEKPREDIKRIAINAHWRDSAGGALPRRPPHYAADVRPW